MERLLLAVLLVVWCRVTVATVMLCYACFPTCSEDNDDTTECSGSCWNYTTTDTHGSSGTWSVQLHTTPECSGSCWNYTTTDTHGSSGTWSVLLHTTPECFGSSWNYTTRGSSGTRSVLLHTGLAERNDSLPPGL